MPKGITGEEMRCIDNLLKLRLKKALKNREKCTNMGRLVTKFVACTAGQSSLTPKKPEKYRNFRMLVPWHRSCYYRCGLHKDNWNGLAGAPFRGFRENEEEDCQK